MEIRKDILGQIPEIEDTIVFNPPHYKGLIFGICEGFSAVGLPKVRLIQSLWASHNALHNDGTYSPKTGFVVVKNKKYEK